VTTHRAVVIQGAKRIEDIPGIERIGDAVDLRFSNSASQLESALSGAEILLSWDFRAGELRDAWHRADRLRWIHWAAAGVDAALFPELVTSDVVLTNSQGVFDRAMAEYVLGVVIAFAKRLPESLALQSQRSWKYRLTERIEGRRALVVGAGSIGRQIAQLLRAAGLQVTGIGTRARDGDPDFGRIHPVSELADWLPQAHYVIAVTPLTDATRGLFGAREFHAMKPTARFINVGRGEVVQEAALVDALRQGEIAGAALDVFETEPLPADNPLWSMPQVIISPHMSGDFEEHPQALSDLFVENFRRYRESEPLLNVVDKSLGYIPGDSTTTNDTAPVR
jgi:phosphoglycerate dehydrogenase-like enzyme